MRILQHLKMQPASNSLTPFRRRARIRRLVQILFGMVWVLIVLALLAVTGLRLTMCAETPINIHSPIRPIYASSRMPSETFHSEPTAGVDERDQ